MSSPDPLPSACSCLLSEHCDRTRPGCRLKAGATINQGGGICGPYEKRSDPLPSDEAVEAAWREAHEASRDYIAQPTVRAALTAAYRIDMPRREAEVRAEYEAEVERLRAGLADVRATCFAGANAIEPRNVIGRVIGIADAALDGNWRI